MGSKGKENFKNSEHGFPPRLKACFGARKLTAPKRSTITSLLKQIRPLTNGGSCEALSAEALRVSSSPKVNIQSLAYSEPWRSWKVSCCCAELLASHTSVARSSLSSLTSPSSICEAPIMPSSFEIFSLWCLA